VRTLSIKWQAAIAATASAVLLIVLVGAIQLHFMRQDLTRVLSDAQSALVSRAAEELDSKLALHRDILAGSASAIPPQALRSPQAFREYYAGHRTLLALFDDLLLLSPSGRIISDAPEVPGRAGIEAGDRPFFKEVMRTRKPLIAEPVISKARKEPIVQMVVPVLAKDGQVLAILVGVLRLDRNNFLAGLGSAKVGNSGYFFVMTKGPQPVLVVHPDSRRLVLPRLDGANVAGDVALKGFEGTVETVNSHGEPALLSYKSLNTTNWVLGAMLPGEEAFAPLIEAEHRTYLVSALAALLIAPLVWLMTWRLLSPLTTLRAAIHNLHSGDKVFTPVPVVRDDEVGDLANNFNLLMADRDEVDARLRESEYRLRMVTDNMPALIAYIDRHLRFRFTNKTYSDWFGYEPEHLLGRSVLDFVGADIFASIQPYLEQALLGERVSFSHVMHTPGKRRMVEVTLIPHCSQQGEAAGAYTLIHDITELKEVESKLSQLVRFDTLTLLPNRYCFNERLADAIARSERTRAQLALMFLDVDHFKAINDTHGHEAGDEVLKEFSRRVSDSVRSTDTVARLAGDEFVVILEGLRDTGETHVVARKILASLERPFQVGEHRITVSTSIGIANRVPGLVDAGELLRQADKALYVAKREGRNRYHVDASEEDAVDTVGTPALTAA
jgi:diguanylate cyclase (GGDEF)-like protein/PAS domain S-box-containing protein